MNEKIKELAKQAFIQCREDVDTGKDPITWEEKFAELIVKECNKVARHTILTGSGVDPDTFTGTVTTVQEIKKHFGIEE